MQKLNSKLIFFILITINLFSNQFSEKIYVYDLGAHFESGYFQLAGKVLGSFEITENGVKNIREEAEGDEINILVQKYKIDLFNELFKNLSIIDKDLIIYSYKVYFSKNFKILLTQEEKNYLENKKSHNATIEYLNNKYVQISKRNNVKNIMDLSELNNLDDQKYYVYKVFKEGDTQSKFGEVYFNRDGTVEKEKIYKLTHLNSSLIEEKNIFQNYRNISKREKVKNCYFNFYEKNTKEKYRLNVISYKTYLFTEKSLLLLNENEKEELEKIKLSKDKEKEINFVNKQKIIYLERQVNCDKIFKDIY